MTTKVERSRRGLLGFYISLLKKAFNTDKLDFGDHVAGGIALFIVVLACWAVIEVMREHHTFINLTADQHLAEARAACGTGVSCTDTYDAIRHLEAIPASSESSAASQLLSRVHEQQLNKGRPAREQMLRNLSGEANDPFKCANGTNNQNIVSFDGGGTWWKDDGRCSDRVQKQRDDNAKSSSYWPSTVRVDTDMNSFWLPDEERTCQTLPDSKGKVSTVRCTTNEGTVHNIPVTFWGGVERNTISDWKCSREKNLLDDHFVCKAID